ncbi:hypothetical protein BpHYR1_040813 [Brachionus plicatilis]|uniref:Mitochondria-eating protein n=1 Tax=Brachionus plicatilis TaxID=10195 RepID=A0A3M7RDK1_BRAPC|nr:hypothetical protein BpHYR1_040813 [Brachionus plicatilis]
MSIRNLDSDLALSNLNDLFHLHRYDDCVLFINRLNYSSLRKVLTQLPIKLYLSRLPYTIEVFEALYAKIFIHDPDSFPTRLLQPERLIDKMVAYFSLINDQKSIEPIDGDKMLDSFENVIRIISYVQPGLYTRLLFFKYACDRACLKFDKELDQSKNLKFPALKNIKLNSSTSAYSVSNLNQYSNTLVISKLSNMSTCEKVKIELVNTINKCHKALLKLNGYMSDLKADKNFKHFKKSSSIERTSRTSSKSSKVRSESVFSLKTASQKDTEFFQTLNSSTICQDYVQNRLFLNKSLMNSIEPFLQTVRVEKMMDNLMEKINLDKEILLREDTYLTSLEPLQPLFKRYSLGFERCIQIWRKKCSADQLLLYNNPSNYDQVKQQLENSLFGLNEVVESTPAKSTSSVKRKNFLLKRNYLNTLSASSDIAAKIVNSMDTMTDLLNSNISINCYNLGDDVSLEPENQKYHSVIEHQKIYLNTSTTGFNLKSIFFIDISFYTNPSGNSTLPSKFKTKKRTSILNNKIFQNIRLEDGQNEEFDKIDKQTPILKNSEVQTSQEIIEKNEIDQNDYSKQIEILREELSRANDKVKSLELSEQKLKSKLNEKELELGEKLKKPQMIDHYSSTRSLLMTESENKESMDLLTNLISEGHSQFNNYQHSLDLINFYNNLNTKYRYEAYQSLDAMNDMKPMTEFKIKLLFSVVVYWFDLMVDNNFTKLRGYNRRKSVKWVILGVNELSYRYVKIYIRDLKRKVKVILQINDRTSKDRSLSVKSQNRNPTIIIEKFEDKIKIDQKASPSQVFFKDENRSRKNSQIMKMNRFSSMSGSNQSDTDSPCLIIDQAINKYLQMVSWSNTFDLSRVIKEVKEQLWATLQEYPLKECQELNDYINESVKTAWALVNHDPALKLDYTSTKFDSMLHERSQESNKNSDQIINFVWPSLIDTQDNKCVSKGIKS